MNNPPATNFVKKWVDFWLPKYIRRYIMSVNVSDVLNSVARSLVATEICQYRGSTDGSSRSPKQIAITDAGLYLERKYATDLIHHRLQGERPTEDDWLTWRQPKM
jgi:hypothetical protein